MDLIVLLKGLFLGVVEGITEFIPVSSTGHLILAGDLIGFNDEKAKVFDVFIQLGAILSVVWLYREKVFAVIRGIASRRDARSFTLNIIIAFLPAAFIGLLTHKAIKAYFFNPITVAIALIAGGIAILLIERMNHRSHVKDVDNITLKQAIGVGIAQCLSLVPGVSRSGATIMGGLLAGFDRKVAVEFSFFLAIPTMVAATGYDLLSNIHGLSLSDVPLFAIGFVTSFFSALIVIKSFLRYVSRHNFSGFAYYRIGFGLLVLAFYWQRGWEF
ncbi:MAG: undecaprenyl-diphosphate phosphatase [Thermodesulfovibrionales bacterium]|nr:undecaprenyl-diphosphate phosphatase [Thermodesulfovibrionales bacterium]